MLSFNHFESITYWMNTNVQDECKCIRNRICIRFFAWFIMLVSVVCRKSSATFSLALVSFRTGNAVFLMWLLHWRAIVASLREEMHQMEWDRPYMDSGITWWYYRPLFLESYWWLILVLLLCSVQARYCHQMYSKREDCCKESNFPQYQDRLHNWFERRHGDWWFERNINFAGTKNKGNIKENLRWVVDGNWAFTS